MKFDRRAIWSAVAMASIAASHAAAQERGMLSRPSTPEQEPRPAAPGAPQQAPMHQPDSVYVCRGPISGVMDVAFEGVKTTQQNWSNPTGGGETRRFDRSPVLSATVRLAAGTCLDAHLSAMVGSRQTYGSSVASITLFQVTLTPATGGPPRHMVGHFDRPYGTYGPAVAIEAEHDVDMLASNFFQRVGDAPGDLAPGAYRVDVWWAGGPVGGGGAIGADFVLKLYFR
jgi:hypothetical protein